MNKTKIISLSVLVIWIALAIYLFYSIRSTIGEKDRIAAIEALIIDRLKVIRDIELAYLAANGKYTGDWDELKTFIDSGNFYITEKSETIITLPYGKDSIVVDIDTLEVIAIRDSLFNDNKWKNFDLNNLIYVPTVKPKTKFHLWTDRISKAGVLVNVIEVRNPKPINPKRDEKSDYNSKKPLRFGSRTSVTTSGNWE